MKGSFMTSLVAAVAGAFVIVIVQGHTQLESAMPNTTNPLVGGWRLVSFESRTGAGEPRQLLGRAPRGQLLYDATGRMSAHLMDPDRPPFASGDQSRGTEVEVRAAVAGYIGYYGTYTVNVQRGVVTHHVEGALFPNWVGSDQVREFRLEKDRLTIKTPPIRVSGEESTTVLVWERVQ